MEKLLARFPSEKALDLSMPVLFAILQTSKDDKTFSGSKVLSQICHLGIFVYITGMQKIIKL